MLVKSEQSVGVGELERRGFTGDFSISYTRKITAIPIIIENISYLAKFTKYEKML